MSPVPDAMTEQDKAREALEDAVSAALRAGMGPHDVRESVEYVIETTDE